MMLVLLLGILKFLCAQARKTSPPSLLRLRLHETYLYGGAKVGESIGGKDKKD